MINHFMEGNNAFSNSSAGIIYSFNLKASESCHLLFGVQANLVYRRINWENLTFANEFDKYRGYIGISEADYEEYAHSLEYAHSVEGSLYGDFAVGFLAAFPNWYFGVAAHHFGSYYIDVEKAYNKLNMKFTFHLGGRIYFAPKEIRYQKEHWFYLAPNLIYQNQGNNNVLSYGLQANYHPIMIGVQLKNTFLFKRDPAFHQDLFESLSFIVGFEYNSVAIGYSYDMSLTKIMKIGGGAHEISLAYIFPCKIRNKKQNFEPIYCPKF
jgi:type IX secretion system PorP/SprF family membrane protein